MSDRGRRDRREPGFTLIEVMAVVLVLGLVAGAALVHLSIRYRMLVIALAAISFAYGMFALPSMRIVTRSR